MPTGGGAEGARNGARGRTDERNYSKATKPTTRGEGSCHDASTDFRTTATTDAVIRLQSESSAVARSAYSYRIKNKITHPLEVFQSWFPLERRACRRRTTRLWKHPGRDLPEAILFVASAPLIYEKIASQNHTITGDHSKH